MTAWSEGFETGPAGAAITTGNTTFDTVVDATVGGPALFVSAPVHGGALAAGPDTGTLVASGSSMTKAQAEEGTWRTWHLSDDTTELADATALVTGILVGPSLVGALVYYPNFLAPANGWQILGGDTPTGTVVDSGWVELVMEVLLTGITLTLRDAGGTVLLTTPIAAATMAAVAADMPNTTLSTGAVNQAFSDPGRLWLFLDDCSWTPVGPSGAKPVRLWPRDDGRGLSSAPSPATASRAQRVVGGYQ